MNRLPPTTRTATIAATKNISDVVDIDQYQIGALVMPAAWDTATITLQASATRDGTFLDVYDDEGAAITVVAAANRVVVIDKAVFATAGLKYLKFKTSAAQTAERKIIVILKG